jgi:hypothetical protein
MPLFMLLINYDPTVPSDGSPSRQPQHAALTEEMRLHGHYRNGGGLAPVERYVKRLTRAGGKPVFLDGPFAETREALGGYFLVECSEEEALAYAERLSVNNRSWVEVRRVGIYVPQESGG